MRKFTLIVVLVVALALALAACGGNDEPQTTNSPAEQAAANNNTNESVAAVAGDPERGATLYVSSCVACHGPDGSGVVGLGLSLHPDDSELVRESSDEELVEFIKVGRQPDHPENTTGIAMPPKGGNPALSEEGIYDIVAWMRTLD